MIKVKPIIFSTKMVKSILEGRKTQTRRVVKPQPDGYNVLWPNDESHVEWADIIDDTQYYVDCDYCLQGKIGDLLWVRETWGTETCYWWRKPSELPEDAQIYYRSFLWAWNRIPNSWIAKEKK